MRDLVERNEMVEALTEQRKRMGAEYDCLNAELNRLRSVAVAEIKKLQRRLEDANIELRNLGNMGIHHAQLTLPENVKKVLLIAEDVVWYDWSSNDSDAVHTIQQLRLALAAITLTLRKLQDIIDDQADRILDLEAALERSPAEKTGE